MHVGGWDEGSVGCHVINACMQQAATMAAWTSHASPRGGALVWGSLATSQGTRPTAHKGTPRTKRNTNWCLGPQGHTSHKEQHGLGPGLLLSYRLTRPQPSCRTMALRMKGKRLGESWSPLPGRALRTLAFKNEENKNVIVSQGALPTLIQVGAAGGCGERGEWRGGRAWALH